MTRDGEAAEPDILADPSDILSGGLEGGDAEARSPRLRLAGLAVIVVIALAAVLVPLVTIEAERNEMLTGLERRLETLAGSRAEVIATWLDGTHRLAGRIVDSELFRLFATEMELSGGDLTHLSVPEARAPGDGSIDQSLVLQIPYMEQVLSDFAREAHLVGAYMMDRNGTLFVASGGAPRLSAWQIERARAAFDGGGTPHGPARSDSSGLMIDQFLPIYPTQQEPGEGRPAAVLLLVAPVGPKLTDILAPTNLSLPGERVRLLQRDATGMVEVRPGAAPPIGRLALDVPEPGQGAIAFARHRSLNGSIGDSSTGDGSGDVYAAGAKVPGSAWWVLQEAPASTAEAGLRTFAKTAVSLAALVVIAVVAAFGSFWWKLTSAHDRDLAGQYRVLAGRIAAQKRLLESINGTIADWIGLKSPNGAYRYVNPAFAKAVGREVEEVLGLDDAAVFGAGTARRLELSDQIARQGGTILTSNEEVYLDGNLRHLQISKVPLHDDAERVAGIVSVARDVTDLIEEQKKKQRAIEQAVAALVRAVELRDPYLAGHSRRVAGFADEVARQMGADAECRATLDVAAKLSQIGKVIVPRHILTKSARLEPAERAVMEQHIENAAEILKGIDFGLPVLDAVCQMHERLDGGGYPNKLRGPDIVPAARVLGVCDVFCARIEPRSYRAGIAPTSALEILEQNSARYDPQVVAALREVATSVAGEKLIASLSAA